MLKYLLTLTTSVNFFNHKFHNLFISVMHKARNSYVDKSHNQTLINKPLHWMQNTCTEAIKYQHPNNLQKQRVTIVTVNLYINQQEFIPRHWHASWPKPDESSFRRTALRRNRTLGCWGSSGPYRDNTWHQRRDSNGVRLAIDSRSSNCDSSAGRRRGWRLQLHLYPSNLCACPLGYLRKLRRTFCWRAGRSGLGCKRFQIRRSRSLVDSSMSWWDSRLRRGWRSIRTLKSRFLDNKSELQYKSIIYKIKFQKLTSSINGRLKRAGIQPI